jgi:S1-C subfamily serine protease
MWAFRLPDAFAVMLLSVHSLYETCCAGQVIRPVLGITMGPPALISRLNIDGVLVYSAPRGGPAGDAGVQGCQRSQFGDLVVGV